MDRDEAHDVLHELSRKLLLLELERKSSRRKEIINSILLSKEGELEHLKELLGLNKKND